jgi:integrase
MAKPRRKKGWPKDTWELRIYMGRKANGQADVKSIMFHGTQAKANAEQARLEVKSREERQKNRGKELSQNGWGSNTTINDAFEKYLKSPRWDRLSPSTQLRYSNLYKKHLQDNIGKRSIASLSPLDIEEFLLRMKKGSSKSPPQSHSSVNQARVLIRNACREAAKGSHGEIRNPARFADLPVWDSSELRDEPGSPTASDVAKILQTSATDKSFYAYLWLISATGMRRGEACAIKWQDWDEKAKTIRITQGIAAARGGAKEKSPKTRKANRRISIGTEATKALRAYRQEVERLAKLGGFSIEPTHFVFSRTLPGEKPPHPDTMSHMMARSRQRAGVDMDVGLHSLRHFQSTTIDGVVSEIQIQARLGWSSQRMQRHYTDAVTEEDRKAAAHVERTLRQVMKGKPRKS